ncbi:MAG: hypothetical protein K5929_07480 [Lachnospiraceae bacterium]|nr:hypothetical protein [Lachnospiraceae bacterium]
MRIWFKIFKDNRMLNDMTVEDHSGETRTHKVYKALDEACRKFDLGRPLWLESTVRDFKAHAKARFRQDSFIEHIDFDFLEIHVLEEDY